MESAPSCDSSAASTRSRPRGQVAKNFSMSSVTSDRCLQFELASESIYLAFRAFLACYAPTGMIFVALMSSGPEPCISRARRESEVSRIHNSGAGSSRLGLIASPESQ
jgi:hypothetical protein